MNAILIQYISFAHLITFTLLFFFLDKLYSKSKINYLIIFLIFIFSVYVGKNYSNLDRLILLIFFLFLSVKNSESKNIARSLLIVDLSYLLEIIISRIMRPFFLISLQTDQEWKKVFLFILIVFCTLIYIFVVTWFVNKYILTRIEYEKKESAMIYGLTLCLLAYQTFWLISNYANDIPLFRGFILVFYAIIISFIAYIIQIISKNEELKFLARQRKLEYEMMLKYSEEMKKQYQEIRKFRHDYINILSSIEYYLEEDNLEELREFYQSRIQSTKSIFKSNMLSLEDLQKIDSLEIKSIFMTKLIMAQEKNIDVGIEVESIAFKQLFVDPIILIRIIGILLDNSIEELEELEEGKLLVGIFNLKSDLVIVIKNTVRKNVEPLHLLRKSGFSTKGDNRGLGLSTVDELLVLEPNILLETSIKEDYFIQKITIIGGG